jgi:hypothetical protein
MVIENGVRGVGAELPQIFSDEEFDRHLKARTALPRGDHERWDNAAARPLKQRGDGLPESCIEQQFPHIALKLSLVWPSDACAMYIADLVVNRREERQGFPKEVLEDLLMLHAINDMLLRAGKQRSRRVAPASPQ